jgi:hypothetical protein
LLLPQLAPGAAGTLDVLLAACDAALADGLARGVERVVVIGTGAATARFDARSPGAAAGFGAPDPDEPSIEREPAPFTAALPRPVPPPLPLSLAVGRFLLGRSAWTGPTQFWSVATQSTPAECVALGRRLSDGPSAMFLVLGDGSGVGRNAPPGAALPGAEPFDDAIWAALGTVDTAALLDLDPGRAAELTAAGRPAWQVLAGGVQAAGGTWTAHAHHREAPYGVGYFVASWARG